MPDDIEDFIRRAAERRKQQQQGQPAQRKPAERPAAPVPAQPRVPLAAPLKPAPVVEAEIVSAEVVEHVSSHVATHLSTTQFDQRAAQLGEETALADDRLEARLHQKFDHQLGRLTPTSVTNTAMPGAATTSERPTMLHVISPGSLVEMLRSPQQIRNAIILSEILARPEHRW